MVVVDSRSGEVVVLMVVVVVVVAVIGAEVAG